MLPEPGDEEELPPGDEDELDPPADDTDLPPDKGADDDDPPEDDEPPARQESRASRDVRQLRERAQAAESRAARADELEREIAQLRQPARVDPAIEEQRFQERIRDLPYEQQILEVRNRERALFGQQLQGMELRMAQSDDRAAFSDLKRDNPVANRHSGEVEKRFKDFQSKGNFVSREIILKNLLGEIALERGPAAARRSGQQGRDRIAAERGRPGARRGDSPPAGGRRDDMSLEATEARLHAAFNAGATLADT